jgi:pimeloyl-ACP methyl ester carboxylesterase
VNQFSVDRPPVYDRQGAGPAVVLLHGQPGSAADWQWLAPKLADEFCVLVPDRPGYGRTAGDAVGFDGNARSLVALLDAAGTDRAVVVGHSWAGGAALAAAERYPERVAGLVLVASVGPGDRPGWEDRLLAAPMAGDIIAVLTIGLPGRLLGSARVQQAVDRRLHGQALDVVRALAWLTGARTGTRVWRSFVIEQRALLSELPRLEPGLADISAPTQVVNGESDRIVPVAVGYHLARAIPGAGHTVIPHAGHLLPHDHPGVIADAVRQVWARADYTAR